MVDTCAHLIMLHVPNRIDCDEWLQTFGHASLFEMAQALVPADIMASVLPIQWMGHDPDQDLALQPPVQLNLDQILAFNQLLNSRYSIVHGSAGTGKSTLIQELCRFLRSNGNYEAILLAPSGVAACNIGGTTLHRFFGAQPSERFVPNQFVVDGYLHSIHTRGKRPYLILDEYSMISAETLDEIDRVLRAVQARPEYPFGRQLGRIVHGSSGQDETDINRVWLWNATVFPGLGPLTLRLACRQANHANFFHLLSIVRRGPANDGERQLAQTVLDARRFETIPEGQQPLHITALSSKRAFVDMINNEMKDKVVPANQYEIEAIDNIVVTEHGGNDRDGQGDVLERETNLLKTLVLWRGARVIVTSNVAPARGVVNGTIAHVRRYHNNQLSLRHSDGNVFLLDRITRRQSTGCYSRCQFPVLLAFALTIHRAQGLTLDKVVVNLADMFSPGLAYVAMSRVRQVENMWLVNIPTDISTLFPPQRLRARLQKRLLLSHPPFHSAVF